MTSTTAQTPRSHLVTKRAAVIERSSADGKLVFIGDPSPGGTYVLRIRVHKLQQVAFGRFRDGKVISLKPGEYVYVGSAQGGNGHALSLARRLVRHATRIGSHPPHPIRRLMLEQFPDVLDADAESLVAKEPKKPRWHVDFLLDRKAVELVGAYIISSPLPIEARLARDLEADPGTFVFEKGAGASDIPGNTHLLRIDAGPEWWAGRTGLPARIRHVLLLKKLAGRHQAFQEWLGSVAVAGRLSAGQSVTLLNMWIERAAGILTRMGDGASFTKAQDETGDMYDTCHWGEVLSRLQRARGSFNKVVDRIVDGHGLSEDQRQTLTDRCRQIGYLAVELRAAIAGIVAVENPDATGIATASKSKASAYDPLRSFELLNGDLKLCIRYLSKNLHDAPLVLEKTGIRLTVLLQTKILTELDRILEIGSAVGAGGRHR